jgi:hypothetical protein
MTYHGTAAALSRDRQRSIIGHSFDVADHLTALCSTLRSAPEQGVGCEADNVAGDLDGGCDVGGC